MAMPWTEAREFAQAIDRIERERLLMQAIALRAAQADEQGWRRWTQALSATER